MKPWSDEERRMAEALAEAEKGRGRTHPNPIVGCVVVERGEIVARGHHEKAGGPHAEVVALTAAGERARGADVYVTLEPCAHHGKTPPCTDALIRAGVARVFIGSHDPNPLVDGKGVAQLRAAGIEVTTAVLQEDCDAANEGWFKFITRGVPWVVLKAAVTLDGKLATRSGDSKWVTGEAARARVHEWRNQLDAVLVGAGTVRRDDPRLTVRGVAGGRDPERIVLGGIPRGAKVLPALSLRGALADVLGEIAGRGLTSVLVEGGANVHGAFLRQDLWDELRLFVAPRIAGEGALSWAGFRGVETMEEALRVDVRSVEHIGEDLLIMARPAR